MRAALLLVIFFVLHVGRCLSLSFGQRVLQPRLTDEVLLKKAATELKVSPPLNAPRWLWSAAWKLQTWIQPLLHKFDDVLPTDSFLNLSVLWWKAISGSRVFSNTFDSFVAYDLLPNFTRVIAGFPLCYLFPKLHHQNVALRTRFLDEALTREIEDAAAKGENVVTVALGAGFDTRCLRFLAAFHKQRGSVNDAKAVEFTGKHEGNTKDTEGELDGKGVHSGLSGVGVRRVIPSLWPRSLYMCETDLPTVVEQKRRVLQQRYLQRRPGAPVPTCYNADLNNASHFQETLHTVLDDAAAARNLQTAAPTAAARPTVTRVVVVVEAVLMYVRDGSVLPALKALTSVATSRGHPLSFVFSDRFPGVIEALPRQQLQLGVGETETVQAGRAGDTGGDTDGAMERKLVDDYLALAGLKLTRWTPKPGRARHMGVAVVRQSPQTDI